MMGTLVCVGIILVGIYVFIYACIAEMNKEIKRD